MASELRNSDSNCISTGHNIMGGQFPFFYKYITIINLYRNKHSRFIENIKLSMMNSRGTVALPLTAKASPLANYSKRTLVLRDLSEFKKISSLLQIIIYVLNYIILDLSVYYTTDVYFLVR